jgi:hypothetical protein
MKTSTKTFAPGDWVRSPYPGLWRVWKVLTFKRLDPLSGKERWATTVFLRRFVSDAFKCSLSQACCAPSLLSALSKQDAAKLRAFMANHVDLYSRFERYEPEPLVAIFNATVFATKGLTRRKAAALVPKDLWLTEMQIEPQLKKLGFVTEGFPTLTLQFVSPDHRMKNGYLVYRFNRVL